MSTYVQYTQTDSVISAHGCGDIDCNVGHCQQCIPQPWLIVTDQLRRHECDHDMCTVLQTLMISISSRRLLFYNNTQFTNNQYMLSAELGVFPAMPAWAMLV